MSSLDKSDILKKRLLKALEKTCGVVTTACKKAKVARSTFYLYRDEDKDFAAQVADIQEQALDFAESQLFKLMKGYTLPETKVFFNKDARPDNQVVTVPIKKHIGPDTTAVIFYLKTKGKERGYVERTEHTGKDGERLFNAKDLTDDRLAAIAAGE
jgi:hypothetical protein